MRRVLRLAGGPPAPGELRRIRRAGSLTWEGGLPPDALFFARPDARVVPPGAPGQAALCLIPGTDEARRAGMLAERRVVVTRQPRDLAATLRAMRAAGFRPLPFPVFELKPMPAPGVLEALRQRAWRFVAITSPQGARCLGRIAREAGISLPPLAAVGERTGRILGDQGLFVELTARHASGMGLVAALKGVVGRGDAVLLLRSAEASADLPAALTALGCIVEEVSLYRAADLVPGTRHALGELMGAGGVDWLTFFSGGAARRFAGLFPGGEWRSVPTAVVGPVTAGQASRLGFAVRAVAARPTPRALIEAMSASEGRPL